jgi:hypothetical protein
LSSVAARVQGQFALIQLAGQGGGQLAAVVGREAGVAHAMGLAVEAADRAVPAIADLAAVVHVDAAQVAGAGGEAHGAFRRVALLSG